MSGQVFEIHFRGVEELMKIAEQRAQLLKKNVGVAVARTVLWGAARIAEDCPVDTGRLRASILGYLVDRFGLSPAEGDPQAVTEGKAQSVTSIEDWQGVIGTNVKYALWVDLGISGPNPRPPLSRKQLRYLFYKGILKKGPGGSVIYTYKRKGQRGKGFFRKNIPLIDRYFQEQMQAAIRATGRGELLPVTF